MKFMRKPPHDPYRILTPEELAEHRKTFPERMEKARKAAQEARDAFPPETHPITHGRRFKGIN